MRQNRAMSEELGIVAQGGFRALGKLRKVLSDSGISSEIVAPPDCDSGG